MGNPFPPTRLALEHPNGLLASGGDLTPPTLIKAYTQGIFPWFEEGQQILWWSPDPRLVLYPENIRVSHSMTKVLRRTHWRIDYDTCFATVMARCADTPRAAQSEPGTWITGGMQSAYDTLHRLGIAHSIEIFDGQRLIGGLYGLLIDQVFFGESMFSLENNTSKMALIALARIAQESGIELIDCQVDNPHLVSLGARLISREDFEKSLRSAIKMPMERILTEPLSLLPTEASPLSQRLNRPLPREAAELL